MAPTEHGFVAAAEYCDARSSSAVAPPDKDKMKVWIRPVGLFILAMCSLVGYLLIRPLSIDGLKHPAGVAAVELGLALPYVLACWWVIVGATPRTHRIYWTEWAVVIGAAFAFFAIVFPLWPSLSGDPYRYVWDARVLAYGYNPLAIAPDSPVLASLRDTLIYPRIHWVHVPTIYPPGAQGLYLLAYLVAPYNVWAIKAEMILGVALVAALLVGYLRMRGQDPLRVIVWLWCPLVVVELGMDGHVDAAAIAVWLAALLLAEHNKQRWMRGVVGVLLGIATLIKLYPALFLLALGRKNDRWLYITFLATVVLGYLPFLHGGAPALGFLGIYVGDVQSYGALLFWLRNAYVSLGAPSVAAPMTALLVAAVVAGTVVWGRYRGRLSEGVALYILLALWLSLTPHLLPWYVTALVPFCTLYLRPPWQSLGSALTGALWLGVCMMPAFNIAFDPAFRNLEWLYAAIYIAVVVSAATGLLLHRHYRRHSRRTGARLRGGQEQQTTLYAATADLV